MWTGPVISSVVDGETIFRADLEEFLLAVLKSVDGDTPKECAAPLRELIREMQR